MFSARQEGQIMMEMDFGVWNLGLSVSSTQIPSVQIQSLLLFYLPDVALAEELVEVGIALLHRLRDLLVEQVVVGRALDGADDADWHRVLRVIHAAEHERYGWILQGLVVDEDVLLRNPILA